MKTELTLLLLVSLACHGEFSETDPNAGSDIDPGGAEQIRGCKKRVQTLVIE